MGYYNGYYCEPPKFKITLREVLLSTVIIAAFIGLGVLISGTIHDSSEKKVHQITSSVQINTPDEFDYCIRTDVGNFMAEGNLEAVDSISIPDISGYYMKIVKKKERYTMHTQVYTTSDGKGHVTTHTRTYWSWDVIHTDEFGADSLKFLGQNVDLRIPSTDYNTTIQESPSIRYRYFTTPTKVSGILIGVIDNHSFTCSFEKGATMKDTVEHAKKNINTPSTIFWVFWIIVMCGAVGLFYWGEYSWLERD